MCLRAYVYTPGLRWRRFLQLRHQGGGERSGDGDTGSRGRFVCVCVCVVCVLYVVGADP